MRKGFSVTLATVAFATLGFQAMAMAPTIGDIPDIVVGSGPTATASNVFVFPDAVDLNTKVTDDDTTPGQIIWSYSVTDPTNATTQVYNLNGVQPVVLASESRVTPPAAKRINSQDSDPAKVDALARTITVRNVKRSPLPAQASYPAPAEGPGILTADTKVVTLHASDGSTASSKNILVYTDNGGNDRFSPAEEIVLDVDLTVGANNASWTFLAEGGTNPTSSRVGGLCMTSLSTADGVQFAGKWFSQYGILNLAQNSVYEARLTVTSSQTTVGLTPAWSMEYDNINATATLGKNEFGGSVVILDNEGGALSPIASVGRAGDQNFSFMMTPMQGQTPQFNNATNGFFTAGNSANLGMRLQFRLFETTAITGHGADAGTLCLADVQVVRHDISDKIVGATPFQLTTFSTTAGAANQIGIDQLAGTDQTTVTVETGNAAVTLRPTGGNWGTAVVYFRPGDTTVNFGSTTGNENRDNWPVAWKSNTIYYIEYELSAPDATTEQNPPDILTIAGDVLTGEMTTDHYCVPNTLDAAAGYPTMNRGISTPRVGTPQKYGAFWHALSPSRSTIVDSDRLRPKLGVLCVPALAPGGRTDNRGAVRIHKVTVQEVSF